MAKFLDGIMYAKKGLNQILTRNLFPASAAAAAGAAAARMQDIAGRDYAPELLCCPRSLLRAGAPPGDGVPLGQLLRQRRGPAYAV